MVDKYSLISFAPSLAVLGATLVIAVLGVRFIARKIREDAQRAGEH